MKVMADDHTSKQGMHSLTASNIFSIPCLNEAPVLLRAINQTFWKICSVATNLLKRACMPKVSLPYYPGNSYHWYGFKGGYKILKLSKYPFFSICKFSKTKIGKVLN